MKRLAAAILMSAFICGPALANDDEVDYVSSRWLKVGVDAPFALFGAYFGQGEFRFSDNMSVLARVGYIDTRWTIRSDVNQFFPQAYQINDGMAGATVGLGGRWYWKGGCMEGFLVENYVQFDVFRTFSGNSVSFPGYGDAGPYLFLLRNYFHVGYSWVSDLGFFVDVLAGVYTNVAFGAPNAAGFFGMNHLEARMNAGWSF